MFRNSRLYINATSILRNTLQHTLPSVNTCPTMYSSNILRGRYVIVSQLGCIRPVHVFLLQYTRDTVVTFLRRPQERTTIWHYSDVIMNAMASQITCVWIVCPAVCSGCRSKKTTKLHIAGLCGGNPSVTGWFPSQRVCNAENVSIWWRHHESSARMVYMCLTWVQNLTKVLTFSCLYRVQYHYIFIAI